MGAPAVSVTFGLSGSLTWFHPDSGSVARGESFINGLLPPDLWRRVKPCYNSTAEVSSVSRYTVLRCRENSVLDIWVMRTQKGLVAAISSSDREPQLMQQQGESPPGKENGFACFVSLQILRGDAFLDPLRACVMKQRGLEELFFHWSPELPQMPLEEEHCMEAGDRALQMLPRAGPQWTHSNRGPGLFLFPASLHPLLDIKSVMLLTVFGTH
ncbi:hypothetical protein H671_2g7822 [Cricetulus griseus]|nr:hypothetical protein H671_2g7822 [Cricetulus griseus]